MAQYWLDIPNDPRSDAEILALFALVNTTSGSTHGMTISTESGVRALRIARATGSSVAIAQFLPVGAVADVDVVAKMTCASTGSTTPGGLAIRMTAASDVAQGYIGAAAGATTARLARQSSSTVSAGAIVGDKTVADQSSAHFRRLTAVGSTLTHKVWFGTREDEAGGESQTTTDELYASGAVGIGGRGTSGLPSVVNLQILAVGTNGDPAPTGPVGGRQRSRLILTPW